MRLTRAEVLERDRKHKAEVRQYRKTNGLCVQCGSDAPAGRARCLRCAAMLREKMRTLRKSRGERGLCKACGEAASGQAMCNRCLDKAANSRRYDYRLARVDEGKCYYCCAPRLKTSRLCIDCQMKQSARNIGDVSLAPFLKRKYEEQCGKCAYTGIDLVLGSKDQKFAASVDHKVPASRGGKTVPENLHWVSFFVNQMKKAMSHEEFIGVCTAIAVRCGGLVKEQEALRG